MWMLCFLLFAFGSAFPFGDFRERDPFGQFHVQLNKLPSAPRQKLCLPSPLIGQICLPSAFQFFLPLQSLSGGRQRCLFIPLIRTYIIKVCPPQEEEEKETLVGENLSGTPKEIMKEEEEEKEVLPDNVNIEVGGEEVEPENFVKNGEESGDVGGENKIIRVSEEIIEVSKVSNPPRQPPPESFDKNSQENVSIMSNLV